MNKRIFMFSILFSIVGGLFLKIFPLPVFPAFADKPSGSGFLTRGTVLVRRDLSLLISFGSERITKNASAAQTKEIIEIDIINCAGYLASAKLEYTSEGLGKAELIPDSKAADYIEKIQLCDYAPDDPYVSSSAYGVISNGMSRRNFKLENPDLSKTFLSLPWSVQVRVNEETKFGYHKALLLEDLNDWADTDGDGGIDVVSISTHCLIKGDICSQTLRWTGWRWAEISRYEFQGDGGC